MDIADQIVQYIKGNGSVSSKQIIANLDISRRSVFHQLSRLTATGVLIKSGKHLNVVYSLSQGQAVPTPPPASPQETPASPANLPKAEELQSEIPPAKQVKTFGNPAVTSGILTNWCRFLRLDPEAVFDSYAAIHSLFPTYQSLGLSTPRAKKGQIKIPKGVWMKLFNLLVWVLAVIWVAIKTLWVFKATRWVLILSLASLLLAGIRCRMDHSSQTPYPTASQDPVSQPSAPAINQQLQEHLEGYKARLTETQDELDKTKNLKRSWRENGTSFTRTKNHCASRLTVMRKIKRNSSKSLSSKRNG